jgi:hypothetical protein
MIVARQFIAWYPCENGNRPVGYGMIGSDRRATIWTINKPGSGSDRALRDGFSIGRVPGHKLPGYDQLVPTTGRRPTSPRNKSRLVLSPSSRPQRLNGFSQAYDLVDLMSGR